MVCVALFPAGTSTTLGLQLSAHLSSYLMQGQAVAGTPTQPSTPAAGANATANATEVLQAPPGTPAVLVPNPADMMSPAPPTHAACAAQRDEVDEGNPNYCCLHLLAYLRFGPFSKSPCHILAGQLQNGKDEEETLAEQAAKTGQAQSFGRTTQRKIQSLKRGHEDDPDAELISVSRKIARSLDFEAEIQKHKMKIDGVKTLISCTEGSQKQGYITQLIELVDNMPEMPTPPDPSAASTRTESTSEAQPFTSPIPEAQFG